MAEDERTFEHLSRMTMDDGLFNEVLERKKTEPQPRNIDISDTNISIIERKHIKRKY